MSEKRNEFLDASDSDEDVGRNSDSDDDFQKGGRTAKKTSVDYEDDSDADEFFSGDEQHQNDHEDEEGDGAKLNKDGEEDTGPSKDNKSETETKKPTKESSSKADNLSNITKPLTKKSLVATEAAVKKSGVVYLSRVPPFMKPLKLRSLLEPYGTINRIFLAPEDPTEYARRVRNGGNKKRSYSEGWVEFVKKKDAKKAVDLLNAQTIGGKKSSWYRDDVWTLKYLSGFKWHHLTEQIAAENAERASRMRAEISKATKENKEFVRNVEKAKVQKTQETKAATKRKKTEDEEDGGAAAAGNGGEDQTKKPRRTFAQVPLAKKRKQEEQPDHVQRVLSKIF